MESRESEELNEQNIGSANESSCDDEFIPCGFTEHNNGTVSCLTRAELFTDDDQPQKFDELESDVVSEGELHQENEDSQDMEEEDLTSKLLLSIQVLFCVQKNNLILYNLYSDSNDLGNQVIWLNV